MELLVVVVLVSSSDLYVNSHTNRYMYAGLWMALYTCRATQAVHISLSRLHLSLRRLHLATEADMHHLSGPASIQGHLQASVHVAIYIGIPI